MKNLNIFFFLPMIFLNPYTVVGPLGSYIFISLITLMFLKSPGVKVPQFLFFSFMVMLVIGLLTSLNSVIRGVPSFSYVIFSLYVFFFIVFGIFLAGEERVNFHDILRSVLLAGVLNGGVIILQLFFPEFRSVLEGFLIDSGNRDWSSGFRYRGLASSGGATLSVFCAIALHTCFYLFSQRNISKLIFLISVVILFFSVFLIGRTGLILSFLVFGAWLLFLGGFGLRSFLWKFLVLSMVLFLVMGLKNFSNELLGPGFYKYTLGFLVSGADGVKEEGTIGALYDFWSIIPTKYPEVLVGYGNYINSDLPSMDPGFNRTIVSMGYPLAFAYYACFFIVFLFASRGKLSFFIPILLLLVVSEFKEPMLLSGYGARALLVALGFWFWCQIHCVIVLKSKGDASTVKDLWNARSTTAFRFK